MNQFIELKLTPQPKADRPNGIKDYTPSMMVINVSDIARIEPFAETTTASGGYLTNLFLRGSEEGILLQERYPFFLDRLRQAGAEVIAIIEPEDMPPLDMTVKQ